MVAAYGGGGRGCLPSTAAAGATTASLGGCGTPLEGWGGEALSTPEWTTVLLMYAYRAKDGHSVSTRIVAHIYDYVSLQYKMVIHMTVRSVGITVFKALHLWPPCGRTVARVGTRAESFFAVILWPVGQQLRRLFAGPEFRRPC